MLIISQTPVRISFFGGGTDYPAYFLKYGGKVLGTTIDQYTRISLKTFKSRFFDHSIRVAYSKTELVKSVEEIEHPSVRASLKHKEIAGNLDIHIFSDLPARTGLGSSSSFTVGFLHALYAMQGKFVTKQKLAEEACFVEQSLIGENVGSQDQFHAAFGGFNVIEFGVNGTKVRPVVLTKEKRELLQDHLVVFYTGMTRYASAIVKAQIEKTAKGFNDRFLHRMLAMVDEAETILTSHPNEGMVAAFGNLLHESWLLKKQLSDHVSNPYIDECYQIARTEGAYGGKLCGAGSGGFLAFFVPPNKKEVLRKKLSKLQEVDIRFETQGSSIIYTKD